MKKPKQGDQQEKYCLLFQPLKCVTSKQFSLIYFIYNLV